jgi:hypothetical protein
MKSPSPFALASLVLLASPTLAQTLNIEHRAVACATAGKFPRFEASFSPADSIATARVFFQGQTADWYSVSMKAEGNGFAGVLPKPKTDLKSFKYYIEVTDKAMATSRTAEYLTMVIGSSGGCAGKATAGALGSASVVVQGPAGAAPVPAGCAPTGVIAGSSAGASGASGATGAGPGAAGAAAGVAAGAAAAGTGGGVGATALVVGGVAAAGVAVGVAKKGGDDGGSNSSGSGTSGGGTPGPSPTPTPIRLDVVITSASGSSGSISTPNIDVSACRANTTFGGGPINLRSDGSFDETWNINSPALRVAGRGDANGIQATLTCLSGGGPTGSLSATGSGYSLSGTFTFGSSQFGSQGTISVRRVP